MAVFLEGLEAVVQPCTLALLVPAVFLVLVSRRRALLGVLGFVVGAAVVAWLRFADAWFAVPTGVGAVGVALVFAGVVVGLRRLPGGADGLAMPLAAIGGAVTGWLWQPCVGTELASIINAAPGDALGTFGPTLAYVLGASLLAVVVALVPIAVPRVARWRDSSVAGMVGLIGGVVIATLIAVGAYDDVVAELLRRSSV